VKDSGRERGGEREKRGKDFLYSDVCQGF